MTSVRQVYEAMQAIAPLELAEHWDNPGLLVDCGGQMHRVLAALDITHEVVAEAAAKQQTGQKLQKLLLFLRGEPVLQLRMILAVHKRYLLLSANPVQLSVRHGSDAYICNRYSGQDL